MLNQADLAIRAALGSDANAATKQALAKDQDIQDKGGRMASFEDVADAYHKDGILGAVKQVVADVPSAAGQIAPSIGTAFVGGRLGALIGAPLGPIGSAVGAAIGAGAAAFLPQVGQNLESQAQQQQAEGKPVNVNVGTAAVTGAGQAALEDVAKLGVFGKRLTGRLLGIATRDGGEAAERALVQTAQRSLAGTAARGAARGVASELPTEVAQQVLQRAQAGQPLLNQDAMMDYANAGYLGAVGGGAAGVIAGPAERASARNELAEKGVNPQTGEKVTPPGTAPDARTQQLMDEQQPASIGAQSREARRAAEDAAELQAQQDEQAQFAEEMGHYGRDDLDLTRPTADLEAERNTLATRLAQLEDEHNIPSATTANGLPAKLTSDQTKQRNRFMTDTVAPLTGRLASINAQLQDRLVQQGLPQADAARRVQDAQAAVRQLPESLQARQAAIPLLRGDMAGTDTQVLAAQRQALSDQFNQLPQDQRVLHAALTQELAERRRNQAAADAQATALRRAQAAEAQRRSAAATEQTAQLPDELQAEYAAEAFREPVLTPEVLAQSGLPKQAGYTKRLAGLDLRDPEQLARAQKEVSDALANPRVSDAAKQGLQDLVSRPLATDLKTSMDQAAAAAPGPINTVEDIPTDAPFTKEALRAMGVSKNASIYRKPGFQELDPTDPEQRQAIMQSLQALSTDSDSETLRTNAARMAQRMAQRWGDENGIVDTSGTGPAVAGPGGEAAPGGDAGAAPESLGTLRSTVAGDVGTAQPAVGGAQPREPALTPPAPTAPVDHTTNILQNPLQVTTRSQNVSPLYDHRGAQAVEGRSQAAQWLHDRAVEADDPKADPEGVELSDGTVVPRRDAVMAVMDALHNGVGASSPSLRAALGISGKSARAMLDTLSGIGAIKVDRGSANVESPANVQSVDYRANAGAGNNAGVVTDALLDAVEDGDVRAALTEIAHGGDGGQFGTIASWLANRMLQIGGMPKIVLHDSLTDAHGRAVQGQYDPATDTIHLVNGEVDSHTLLHEATHAYVHKFLQHQARVGYNHQHAKALLDLYAHVKRVLGPDADDYGLTNVSEFASEAMSNPEFQMKLMGIPYKKTTLWRKVVDWVADALGLPQGQRNVVNNTMLAAIVHVDGLMEPGRRLQQYSSQDLVPNQVVNLIQDNLAPAGGLTASDYQAIAEAPDQVHRRGMRAWFSGFSQANTGVSRTTWVRMQTVDNAASVAEKLGAVYNEGVRNAWGELNPLHYLRQATDYKRMALQVFRLGGMRKDENGFYQAVQIKDANGNDASPSLALTKIAELAKKNGLSYDGMKARVATVLEGMHASELRKYNDDVERAALGLEASRKPEDDAKADRLRETKIRLHLTNAEIDQAVDQFSRSPEIQEIQGILNATRNNLIDQMVSSGRLTEEQGETWKSRTHYVPYDRVREAFDNNPVHARGVTGIGQLGQAPELEGSFTRPVANAVDNYMNTLSWMTGQAMRNDAVLRVLRSMEATRAPDGTPYARLMAYRESVKNKNVSPVVYEKGQPLRFELASPADVAAFSQAEAPETGIINGLAYTARLLRASITALPTFTLSQSFKDLPRVYEQGGTKAGVRTMARVIPNLFKEVYHAARGTESKGGHALASYAVVGNYDYNPVDPLQTLEHEVGAHKYNAFKRVLYHLEQIAKAGDQASRQAIYEQTMLETMKDGKPGSGDQALALVRAREFINYNRRGASRSMRVLTKIVPFFNAQVQGLDLMYRNVKGIDTTTGLSGRRATMFALGRMMPMLAMGMLYAWNMYDDEDYKNAPDYVRDKGWILPHAVSSLFDHGGVHVPIVIPTPQEYSFIFKMVPERVIQAMRDSSKGEDTSSWDVAKSIAAAGWYSYGSVPMPPVLKTGLEDVANYSFFTGRPLVGDSMSQRPAALQYTNGTSMIARELGKLTNVSPIKIDNTLTGLLGTTASIAMRASDAVLRPGAQPLTPDRIPGVSSFFGSAKGGRNVDEFYDLKGHVDQAVAAERALRGDPQAHAAFMQENRGYLALKTYASKVAKQLSQLRQMQSLLLNNQSLSMGKLQRQAELRRINELEQQLTASAAKMRGIAVRLQK
jgi:hypothetical protein